jgi:cysteine desulfurase/selenocysteine lyase
MQKTMVAEPGFDIERLRREEFPIAPEWAYLDHAAVSPMPNRTAEVMRQRIDTFQNPSLEDGSRERLGLLAKERAGGLMKVPAAQVALQSNLGEAMAVVANGLLWTPGDQVVIPEMEFSSLVYPWMNLQSRGVGVVWAKKHGPSTPIESIEAALTDRTRVVAVSHVEFLNGYRHDMEALGKLCAERGILLAVDATQSLGVLPIDAAAWQADVVAAHGYKWMMAFHGIAVLYVSERAMDRIAPTLPGRQSVSGGFESLDFALDWHPDARRYESGGPSWIGAAAIATSLGIVEDIGIEAASRQAMGVASRVLDGLAGLPLKIMSDLDPAHRSQIVAFTSGSEERDAELVRELRARHVYVGKRNMGIRVACHFWNTEDDADRLIDGLRELLV